MKFIGYKVPQCSRMLFRSFQFLVFIFSNGILFVCFILCSHDQAYIYFMVMKRKLLIAPHTTKFMLFLSPLVNRSPIYTLECTSGGKSWHQTHMLKFVILHFMCLFISYALFCLMSPLLRQIIVSTVSRDT